MKTKLQQSKPAVALWSRGKEAVMPTYELFLNNVQCSISPPT